MQKKKKQQKTNKTKKTNKQENTHFVNIQGNSYPNNFFFLTLKTKHSVNIVKMGIGWLLLTSH